MLCDKIRFDEACRRVNSGGRLLKGIGTESEKSVHAVLKNYFEPCQDSQEQKIGGFVADIAGENGIIEIQTGHFASLVPKLEAFLQVTRVTVVYPVFVKKRIVTIDGETGEVTSRRTSPLKETPYEIFRRIFPICPFLANDRLSFDIASLEADEYRIPPECIGKKKNRRNRLSVYDRVPTALDGEIVIGCPHDWQQLIPCLFEKDFTSADAAESAGISQSTAAMALSALYRGEILLRSGKKGNFYTYSFREHK